MVDDVQKSSGDPNAIPLLYSWFSDGVLGLGTTRQPGPPSLPVRLIVHRSFSCSQPARLVAPDTASHGMHDM